MATLNVKQTWQIICGAMEIEELSKYGRIKEWSPKNDRHALFLMIKYPDTRFYKGGWGPELLYFSDQGLAIGKVGKMLLTYSRYKEVANWFLVNTFPP